MTKPNRADVVPTNSRSRKWWHRIAGLGIQLAQRMKGLPGYKAKHVVLYIGKLRSTAIQQALLGGQLNEMARQRKCNPHEISVELNNYNDWCLSMTTPCGRWERWEEIQKQPYAIYRPKFIPDEYKAAFHQAIESAAWEMIGRDYDEKQLFGIALNWIMGVARSTYRRILDGSEHTTVCSGAVASTYRKALKNVGLDIQIIGGIHSEKVAPAHYAKFTEDLERIGGTDERL